MIYLRPSSRRHSRAVEAQTQTVFHHPIHTSEDQLYPRATQQAREILSDTEQHYFGFAGCVKGDFKIVLAEGGAKQQQRLTSSDVAI